MIASGSGHFNATTRFTYNAFGLPLTVTDPMGTVTRNDYDSWGNLVSIVRAAGTLNQTTSFTYNSRGDPLSVTNPLGYVTTSTFDPGRRLTATTLPSPTGATDGGVTTSLTYDADGNVLQTRQSLAGSVLRTTSSTWTRTGKVATATNANGAVTRYAYDLLDRLVRTTDAVGRVTEFAYDAVSRPTQTFNKAIQPGALLTQSWTADGLRAPLADAKANTTSFA